MDTLRCRDPAHSSERDIRRHITYFLYTMTGCRIGPLHEPFSKEEEDAMVEMIREGMASLV